MNSKTIVAWTLGVVVLATPFAVWVGVLEFGRFSEWALYLLWLAPLFAAFVTSFLAPSRKFFLGASMAIPAALISLAINLIFQAGDRAVDFPFFKGGWILFLATLSFAVVLSVIGALLGLCLAKWRESRKKFL